MFLNQNKYTKLYSLCKIVIRPVLLYARKTWPTTKGNKEKISILKKRILRKIYGPKINITQRYELRSNLEFQQLYKEPDIQAELYGIKE